MKKHREHETWCVLGILSSLVEDDGSGEVGGDYEGSVTLW